LVERPRNCPVCARFRFNRDDAIQFYARRAGFRLYWGESSTAAVSSARKITEAEAVRARRDMVYAQHQVGWALDRLCEMDGARWV
jgi:hypothetical protein